MRRVLRMHVLNPCYLLKEAYKYINTKPDFIYIIDGLALTKNNINTIGDYYNEIISGN